jgi:hypothetical protein
MSEVNVFEDYNSLAFPSASEKLLELFLSLKSLLLLRVLIMLYNLEVLPFPSPLCGL